MPITTTPTGPQGEFSTYTPIYSQTLPSSGSITFNNIPTTYTDLVCVLEGNSITGNSGIGVQFNGISGSSYSTTILEGNGSSATSERYNNAGLIRIAWNGLWQTSGRQNLIFHVMNYSNPTTYKPVLCRNNSSGTYVEAMAGVFMSTAPITSMTISGTSYSIASGSTVTLYGIRDAANPLTQYGASAVNTVYTPTTLGSSFKVGDQIYVPYTGASQTISVPAGVGICQFEVFGAAGGTAYQSTSNGKGGYVKGLYNFNNAATTTYAYVGGVGASRLASTGSGTLAGGFNGGGNGFWAGNDSRQGYAGSGGGGGTDLRIGGTALSNRVIVAGGGGGEGGGTAGDGKYPTGGTGYPLTAGDPFSAQGGFGGTQSAGGAGGGRAGTGSSANGNAGSLGVGGDGGNDRTYGQGGGGGGGYYGGGGGGTCSNGTGGAGGGGSSYIGGVTSATTADGVNNSNGYAIITRLS